MGMKIKRTYWDTRVKNVPLQGSFMSMFISATAQTTTFSHCAWGFILCSWHLKNLNNIIFEFMICRWSLTGQRSMCPGLGASVPSGSFLLPPPLGPWLPALPGSKQLETPSDSVGAQLLEQQEWGRHRWGYFWRPVLNPRVSLCPKEHGINWQAKHSTTSQERPRKGRHFHPAFWTGALPHIFTVHWALQMM